MKLTLPAPYQQRAPGLVVSTNVSDAVRYLVTGHKMRHG